MATQVAARQSARNQGYRVIQLDFIRGLAILAVMEFHFHTVPVQNVFARGFEFIGKRMGWMGVDLFFVLSGFLVGGLLVQELHKSGRILIWRFLMRRMMKIWPAYYVYLLFQIVVRKHPLSTFLLQNLLNIQNYAGTSLNHTWSLAVEEHFYLFLPPLLLFLYTRPQLRARIPLVLGLCCLLVLLCRLVSVFIFHQSEPLWFTHERADSLIFGVLLSWIFYSQRRVFDRWLKRRILLTVVLLVGIMPTLRYGHHTPFIWTIGYTLIYLSMGSLLLLVYGYEGRWTNSLIYRGIAFIGVYSYGIYLWHLSVRDPLAGFAAHLPVGSRWGFLLASQYVSAIILGIITTKAIEFPMLRLRDRLFPRGPAELAPAHP